MTPFMSEFVGTAVLLTLGNGVVANVVLVKTKGNSGGLIAITFGWAIAVFSGVLIAAKDSGAHLNPAVTIALGYGAQAALEHGAALYAGANAGRHGRCFVGMDCYKQHFDETNDATAQLAVFCTAPSIRNARHNFITEMIGTFIFILPYFISFHLLIVWVALDALPVALVVLGIGLKSWRSNGLCHQPRERFGSPYDACYFAHKKQAGKRLGV